MIPTGVVLLAASSAMAVAGLVAYLLSRDSAGRSRGAAIAVFGHSGSHAPQLMHSSTISMAMARTPRMKN